MFITKISYLLPVVLVVFSSPLSAMDRKMVVTGGISVGDAIVTGRACVVTGLDELDKIRKGDIVIASTTNKSWDNALKLSAGIITEQGDGKSHAASIGQRLGIPVIVGLSGATTTIVDDSRIQLDCAERTIYQVIKARAPLLMRFDKSSSVLPLSHQSLHCGALFCKEYEGSDNGIKNAKTKKEDKYHYLIADITQERLKHDVLAIKKYVTGPAASDISKAWYSGKRLATLFVTPYAYDSIPFEFFENHNNKALEIAFSRLEEGAEYIKEKKDLFKKDVLGDETTLNDSKIAEFLYHNVVNHIAGISDELREDLKKNPIKMDQYVKAEIVNKADYMYYTLLNFATRYYLEQEFAKK